MPPALGAVRVAGFSLTHTADACWLAPCGTPPILLPATPRIHPVFFCTAVLQTSRWSQIACTAPRTCSAPPCRPPWSAWHGERAQRGTARGAACAAACVAECVEHQRPTPRACPAWTWVSATRCEASPSLPSAYHLPATFQEVPAAAGGGHHWYRGQGDRPGHAARHREWLLASQGSVLAFQQAIERAAAGAVATQPSPDMGRLRASSYHARRPPLIMRTGRPPQALPTMRP